MKIIQSWHRNEPSSAGGYGVTVTYFYSSFNQGEIDEIARKLPAGMVVMETGSAACGAKTAEEVRVK